MKKFLVAFLLVFLIQISQYGFAAERKTVYTSHWKGETVTVPAKENHNSQSCSQHGAWHCLVCHVQHSTNGDFSRTPQCDCTYRLGSAPGAGWVQVSSGTTSKKHSCNNTEISPTMQDQYYYCYWKYEVYEYVEKPKCNHNIECSYGYTEGQHPHNGYVWNGVTKSGTCSTCGKTIYNGKCYKPGSITSPTPSSPSPGTGCDHTTVCTNHGVAVGSHGTIDGYTIDYSIAPIMAGKCSNCGEQLYKRECTKGGSDPEPDPHEHSDWESHDGHYYGGDLGSKATTNSRPFSSNIDTSEDYRKNNPFNVGSKFTLFGEGHVAGSVEHEPVTKYWECTGGKTFTCNYADCEYNGFNPCGASGSYLDYNARTPTYTDVYHDVSMSFEGFSVNGKTSFQFREPREDINTQDDRPQMLSTNYSQSYTITSLDAEKLKEDNQTGLLYGFAYAKCQCNLCPVGEYKIYFDLTPPTPEEEEKYTLTLKAEGAPITGGVKIEEDIDYKDYTQKQFAIGGPLKIYANENEGYEFDAWYKVDGKKYSSEYPEASVNMPGFNFTLIAKFLPSTRYNVTVYSDGNGDVKFDGKYDDGQEGWEIAANVIKGDSVSIVANPYENFMVDYWELIKAEDNENLGNGERLTIDDVQEDYIIFVHFKPIDPNKENYKTLITKSWGPGIAIGGTDYAIPGNDYPIWAIPNKDATFYLWTHALGYGGVDKESDYGAKDIIKMPDDRYVLTAWFDPPFNNTYYQVIVEGDGNGDISIEGGDKKTKDTTTVIDGTVITIEAYPDEDFKFDKWTDEEGNVIPGGDKTKVTIDEDKIYIAHFEYIGDGVTYKLNVESAGGGKAYRDVEDAIPGEEYHIKAVPNENCEFLYWADKGTDEITNYAKDDYVIMPEKDLTLVAHFREIGEEEDKDKYYLTLKTTEGGTASGEGYYTPDELVEIVATSNSGYEFVGWYEDNQIVSVISYNPPIRMPYYDMTLTAVFKKADDNSENAPFKILSIRDVRWKDYFTSNGTTTNRELYVPSGANGNTVLVNDAKLVDSSFNQHRDIVYGYAVEFELVTTGLSRNASNLVVVPKLYEKTLSGITYPLSVDIGKYASINSSSNSNVEDFVMTWSEKDVEMANNQKAPQVTWRWVWYLPLDVYKEICDNVGNDSDLIVEFDIGVTTVGGPSNQKFDYVKVINSLNRSDWGGKVFTYRLDKTLLEDIYDNANN